MKKFKTRIIVRKGAENVVLKVEDIAFFCRDDSVIFVVDKNDRKYLADGSLSVLQEQLDPVVFFRANRQYILNVHYVKSFKSFEKVKLMISLSVSSSVMVIVSQETAPSFRKWIHEELV